MRCVKPRSLAGLCAAVLVSALVSVIAPGPGAVADPPGATYSVVGQPDTSKHTLLTRCSAADARFNKNDFGGGGFYTAGPTGVVVAPGGRLFALDDGGQRVLSWPNADAMTSCQVADKVIGGPAVLNGPEGITVGPDGTLYVADTLQHVVQIYTPDGAGNYPATPQVVLGEPFVQGGDGGHFVYPRGLAIDDEGNLLVADDYNNRIQIFHPPFTTGQFADDGIHAGANGGLSNPKDIAFSQGSLFIADFNDSRVLRIPGPFDDPMTTYTADAVFTGVGQPVNLTVAADGTLYVTDGGSGGTPSVKAYPHAATSGDQTASATDYTFDGLLTGPSPDNGAQPEPLGIAVTPAGRLVVADYAGYRLVIETPAAVGPSLHISPGTLHDADVQASYKATLHASGGTGTLTWHLTGAGALPPGIKLSTTGQLSGKATTTGTYTFGVAVTDRSKPVRTGTATITLTVQPMTIVTALRAGFVGRSYRDHVFARGGKNPTFSLVAGALPPGVKLSKQGVLTGTPTVPGTYDFDVMAVDKGVPQNSATSSVSMTIVPLIIDYGPTDFSADVGQKVTLKPSVVGGKNPLKWSVSNGVLPPGLKLSAFNGQITGTPTTPGTYAFRVTATDSTRSPGPNSGSADLTITVT